MWALGVVLYELLALCHPFEARNQAALVLKIVRGQYEPPAGDYSAGLVRLLDLCLAHAPSRRPHTAELLREPSLRAACESPTTKTRLRRHGNELVHIPVPRRTSSSVSRLRLESEYLGEG